MSVHFSCSDVNLNLMQLWKWSSGEESEKVRSCGRMSTSLRKHNSRSVADAEMLKLIVHLISHPLIRIPSVFPIRIGELLRQHLINPLRSRDGREVNLESDGDTMTCILQQLYDLVSYKIRIIVCSWGRINYVILSCTCAKSRGVGGGNGCPRQTDRYLVLTFSTLL